MSRLERELLDKARDLGADLAGIVSVADLRGNDDVHWPESARSVVVVAVAHPAAKPEMDWWFGRTDPPGNRVLAGIVQELCDWAAADHGLEATHLRYHIERGGIYLKDAAVLAGLGSIGLNNLLITPRYGPRVRLRALTVDTDLEPTGAMSFDPCRDCGAPCRKACPQAAFGAAPPGAPPPPAGRQPGRDGAFTRALCRVQMDLDIADAGPDGPNKIIRYCRACELACPVGS